MNATYWQALYISFCLRIVFKFKQNLFKLRFIVPRRRLTRLKNDEFLFCSFSSCDGFSKLARRLRLMTCDPHRSRRNSRAVCLLLRRLRLSAEKDRAVVARLGDEWKVNDLILGFSFVRQQAKSRTSSETTLALRDIPQTSRFRISASRRSIYYTQVKTDAISGERARTWPWHDLPHVLKGKVTAEKSNAFWSPMVSAIRKRTHIQVTVRWDLVSRPRL